MAGFGDLPNTEASDRVDFSVPVPAGDVLVTIAKSEEKRYDNGSTAINFELGIVDPDPHVGRKLWHKIYTRPGPGWKPAAMGIQRGMLNELLTACGFDPAKPPQDSAHLHDIVFMATIAVERDSKDDTKLRNVVKAVKPKSAYTGKPLLATNASAAKPSTQATTKAHSGQPAW